VYSTVGVRHRVARVCQRQRRLFLLLCCLHCCCCVGFSCFSCLIFIFSLFFVSGPCARLSWPSRQLLSARKSTASYRIVFSTKPRDWLRRTYPKGPILCRVGRKTLTRAVLSCTGPSLKDQIPVVVETVTKSSTIKTFAAAKPEHDSDATKVTSSGAGLQSAQVNKDSTFSVDTSRAGKCCKDDDQSQCIVL